MSVNAISPNTPYPATSPIQDVVAPLKETLLNQMIRLSQSISELSLEEQQILSETWLSFQHDLEQSSDQKHGTSRWLAAVQLGGSLLSCTILSGSALFPKDSPYANLCTLASKISEGGTSCYGNLKQGDIDQMRDALERKMAERNLSGQTHDHVLQAISGVLQAMREFSQIESNLTQQIRF